MQGAPEDQFTTLEPTEEKMQVPACILYFNIYALILLNFGMQYQVVDYDPDKARQVILHEDKNYYPDANEVYPEAEVN